MGKGDDAADFRVHVEGTGATNLEAWFADEAGEERGAYYVYVERMTDD